MAENTNTQQAEGGIPSWLVEFMANQRAVNEALQQSNRHLAQQLESLTNSHKGEPDTAMSTSTSSVVTPATDSAVKPKHSRRHPDPYDHKDESMYP